MELWSRLEPIRALNLPLALLLDLAILFLHESLVSRHDSMKSIGEELGLIHLVPHRKLRHVLDLLLTQLCIYVEVR